MNDNIHSPVCSCNSIAVCLQGVTIRGCTGFDGVFETRGATCGPGPHSKPENLNINADNRLAVAA